MSNDAFEDSAILTQNFVQSLYPEGCFQRPASSAHFNPASRPHFFHTEHQIRNFPDPERQIREIPNPKRQMSKIPNPERQIRENPNPERQIREIPNPERQVREIANTKRQIREIPTPERQIRENPNPERQIRVISDPEKPTGDPCFYGQPKTVAIMNCPYKRLTCLRKKQHVARTISKCGKLCKFCSNHL